MWKVRPAQVTDKPAIDGLLVSVDGDREYLPEDQFVVAEDEDGAILAPPRVERHPLAQGSARCVQTWRRWVGSPRQRNDLFHALFVFEYWDRLRRVKHVGRSRVASILERTVTLFFGGPAERRERS